MLVLSRKVGERVLVGDKIAVTLVRIGPNAVRLGIEAPKDMNIVREELVDLSSPPQAIQESNDGLKDLGRRTINDPLGVADAYDQTTESDLIDHGC